MVTVASSKGTERDFVLDVDKIMEYEAKHPNWSLFDELDAVDKMRFTSLTMLVGFICPLSWREFVAEGYTISDLANIIQSELETLGFTSAEQPSEQADV